MLQKTFTNTTMLVPYNIYATHCNMVNITRSFLWHEFVEEAIVGTVRVFVENQQLLIHNMEITWANGFRNMVRTVRIFVDNVMCK